MPDTAASTDNAGLNNILTGIGGPEGKLLHAKAQQDDATAKAYESGMAKEGKVLDEYHALKQPDTPTLHDLPQHPPSAPNSDPMKAFQNPGVILSLFGSMMTRAPLTAAFKAGGAAMQSYNQARQQEYENQRQTWQDNLDAALKQNGVELDRYNVAMSKYSGDLSKLSAELQGIAAQNKDLVVLNSLKSGKFDTAIQILEKRAELQTHLQQARILAQYRHGHLTGAQLVHDKQITDAQTRLQGVYGLDFSDPSVLENIYKTDPGLMNARNKEIVKLFNEANKPLYQDMLGGDTTDTAGGAGGTADHADMIALAQDAVKQGASREQVVKRLQGAGVSQEEIDQAFPAEVAPPYVAPPINAGPPGASRWGGGRLPNIGQ